MPTRSDMPRVESRAVSKAIKFALEPESPLAPQPVVAWPKTFRRHRACEYLLRVYDYEVTTSALMKHDARGTGPERIVILSRVYYSKDALDRWMSALMERGAREGCSRRDGPRTASTDP